MSFSATYRLQLGPDLSFADARALVPYLRELGISHLYLSPVLQARPGSTHGYDVCDPRRISEELGGEDEFRALCEEAPGIVLDIVPNHMATDDSNPFWADIERRRRFFDVDTRTGLHRRFFDIGELAGVRVEDLAVFEETHSLVLSLVAEGLVDGLRIDHPDGLANPREYLERLRRGGVEHVWVEKIIEPGERLRESWPVEGTTGYEFLNDVMSLFAEPRSEVALTGLWSAWTGDDRSFEELAFEAKLEQAAGTFEPELRRLHQEVDVPNLPLALASFHVYRTYVEPETGVVHAEDRAEIGRAAVSEQLERILLLDEPRHEEFVTRFQQTTGPVMAKGVEDTAFYRYNRLVALNEVGGNPGRIGLSLADFHAANAERAEGHPRALLTTFTHDTKRSPDVRARLVALTWIADEWVAQARVWRESSGGLDDAAEELLVYQTLVGAWPIAGERLDAYLRKALREAKRNSSWLEPDEAHERRVQEFARRMHDEVGPFAERVAALGRRIALAQLLLKLTCPGLPDIYQGDELEALALVDPDNRRPVDWELRRRLLRGLREGAPPTDETAKLFVTWKALRLRARRPDAFAGSYDPVDAGAGACAFERGGEVLVAVPVRDVPAPEGLRPEWTDAFGGAEVGLVLREHPGR